MNMNTTTQHRATFRLGLLAAAIAAAAPAAIAGFQPPNPYGNAWAVGENNRLYGRHADDPSGLFKLASQVPALPAGERIVGLEFSEGRSPLGPAFGWYFLAASGKVFAANTFDDSAMMWNITQLGSQAPVTLSGPSYGFDLDGNHAYVTTTSGQSMLFDLNTNLWSFRPGLVRAGQNAAIGGLAVFDARGANRFVGLDISDGTVVRADIENGAVFAEGPAQYFDGVGDVLPMPFAGSTVAGFDSILFANLLSPIPTAEGWFGGVALNEAGAAHTRLYSFNKQIPYQADGIFFQPPFDMIAQGDSTLRFTAVAFSPSPGPVALGALGVALIGHRRRQVI